MDTTIEPQQRDYAAEEMARIEQAAGIGAPEGGQTESSNLPKTSVPGAVLRAAGEGVGPTAAAWSAFAPSAALGAEFGPVGSLVTGVVGSAIAASSAGWAQHKAAEVIAPETTKKFDELSAADSEQHPVAGAIGRIAASLPMFEFSPGQSVQGVGALLKAARGVALTEAEKGAATATAAQVGLGTGTAVVQPLLMGESPTKQGIAEAFVQSLILGEPRHKLFGHAERAAIVQEEKAKDAAAKKADDPLAPANIGKVYGTDKTQDTPLTAEERGELTELSYKVASGEHISDADVALKGKLLSESPIAQQEFDKLKSVWAHSFTFEMAKQAEIKKAEAERVKAAELESASAPADQSTLTIKPNSPEIPDSSSVPVIPENSNRSEIPNGSPSEPTVTPPVPDQNSLPVPATAPAETAAISPVADQLKVEAAKVAPAPTEAQKEAGNYAKGHVTLDGMNVTIENPAGSTRSGTDASGKPWEVTMPGDYGYIKGTKGADGDHVDVTIGSNPDGFQKVWVVDQVKPDGSFDEHKSLLGYNSKDEALAAYRASFSDGKADSRIGGVTEMTRQEFGDWVKSGKTKQPLAGEHTAIPPTPPPAKAADLMDRFNAALEAGKGQLVSQDRVSGGEGKKQQGGKKGGALFDEPKPGESTKKFTDRLNSTATYADGRRNAKGVLQVDKTSSPTMIAMLAPDGSHVRVSTFYRNPGEIVATAGRKGQSLELAVKDGWKILGAMKGEVTKGKAEAYSVDEWNKAARQMREAISTAKGHAEAVTETGMQAREFDRTDANGEHPSTDHATGDDVVGAHEMGAAAEEPAGESHIEIPAYEPKHSERIWNVLERTKPKRAEDVFDAIVNQKSGREALILVKALGIDISDPKAAAVELSQILKHEHEISQGSREAFQNAILEKTVRQSERESLPPGSSIPERSGAPTGDQPGAGGAKAGADANAASSDRLSEKPAATSSEHPAASPAADVKLPKITVADKDGISDPKAYTKLQAIAERIAERQGHEGREAIEEVADHILGDEHDSAIMVKAGDEPALFYDGQIHTFEGKSFPAPASLLETVGKFTRQKATETIARLTPTPARTADIARSTELAMRALGIRVDRIVDVLAKHFSSGQYKEVLNGKGNVQRIITWTVADAHNPSSANIVALFHEVFHAMFARETPERQAMAHRAVEGATNEMLGIGDFKEHVSDAVKPADRPLVEQEGRVAQALATKLVAEGFNPAEAQSWSQRALRAIKDIYNGTLMAVAKVAGYPISQERAMAYFENRMKMTLSGDNMTWINFLGGPKMKQPDWSSARAGMESVRNSGILPVTNPRKYLETAEGAPVGIAAMNHFVAAVEAQVKLWDAAGNLTGMSDAEVVKQFVKLPKTVGDTPMFGPGETPHTLIADTVKLHGVSPDTKIADLPNELAQTKAAAMSHRLFAAWKAEQDGARVKASHEWKSDANTLSKNNDKLVRLTKDYVDIDYMTAEAKDAMLKLAGEVGQTVRGVRDFAGKEGVLEQTIRQLDEELLNGEALPQSYRAALNNLSRFITDSEKGGLKFSDTLQKVASFGADWSLPPHEIAEALRMHYLATKDPHIGELLRDTPASKTLMATTLAFGKANAHMMELLAIRADAKETQKAQVNKTLQDLVNAGKNQVQAIKDHIEATFVNPKTRNRMMRIADKISTLKRDNYALRDAITRNEAAVNFHDKAFSPVMGEQMAALERKVGISMNNFEVSHGAKVSVPNTASSKPDDFTEKTLSLRSEIGKKGEKPTLTPEIQRWMKSMDDWVSNPANQKHGAKYNEVLETLDKLKNHHVTDVHENMKQGFVQRLLAPIQEKCNFAGTPAARTSGQAFNRYSSLLRAKVDEVIQQGVNFSSELNNARKLCGYPATSESTFWDNIIAPAFHDLEQNGEKVWASATSMQAMVDAGIKHAVNYISSNGTPAMRTAKAQAAVEKLIRQHVSNADFLVKNGEALGNKVLDKSDGYTIWRRVIGKAPFTLPRALTDIAGNFFREHMTAWTGDSLKMENTAAAYEQGDFSKIQERFTPEVWDWFMRSIAYNAKSFFHAPGEGGIKPMASRENVIAAYEDAGGEIVRFAENLSRLHGVKPDSAFVADTVDTVQNFSNLLRAMVGDEAESVRGGSPNPKRFIVDARHVEAAPSEWLKYLQNDQYTMEKIIHGQAFQAAFGRNGAAQDTNLAAAINDQKRLADMMTAWRSAILKENPGLKEQRLQQLIKSKADIEGVNYIGLKNASTHLSELNSVAEHFKAIKGMNNSGNIPELMPWTRLVRTIGGWTVSGVGTAMTAHSVFLEQPIRLLGLNSRSVGMTKTSSLDAARVMADSMLQTFGRELRFAADGILKANGAGIYDPINTNKQRMEVAYNHAYAAYRNAGRVGQAVGKIADMAGALLQTDAFGPGARDKALANQAAGKAIAPTFKVFSPFSWMAECLQISNFITWQRHIEGMVAGGVQHFVENPGHADNPDFKFTRQQMGGFGEREFSFLQHQMAGYGFSLEQLANEAYRNRGSGKPMMSDEVHKAIQQLTLNEITLESSLTSRMPMLQTSGLGVAMNPFLGWPLQKTYQVLRQLREPSGQATTKAMRSGLTAYMAILPIGMAVAWLRNKFDEEVIGRKANISDIGNVHDFKSGVMTALDNASRIGTFGMIGEFANLNLNDDNVRPITLDNRIFLANTIQNVMNSARNLYHQTAPQIASGDFDGAMKTAVDYQTVLRPLFQTLGGNGMLQNLGALNHILALDDAESRTANRISVNNYLRVGGRELNMDVRTMNGMMQTAGTPNPVKPFIGQMVLAAYANDHEGFQAAMKDALSQAKEEMLRHADTPQERAEAMDPEAAKKKVATAFAAMNPLKIVFKTPPTEAEFRKLIAQLPDSGKQSVQQALQLFQHYGMQVGANTSAFAKEKGQTTKLLSDPVASSMFMRMKAGM